MTYIGLPPFYPPGWFWLGGRLADLTGMPAWEMFKPWAIISITAAVVVALVLWAALIRFEYALAVTTATVATTLAYAPTEPYAAIITVLLPPVFVLAWSGLRAGIGPAGEDREIGTAGGPRSSASASSSASPRCSTRCCSAYAAFTLALMALLVAAARSDVGSAAAARGDRGDRRGHRADRLGSVPARRAPRAHPPTRAPPSTTFRSTAHS